MGGRADDVRADAFGAAGLSCAQKCADGRCIAAGHIGWVICHPRSPRSAFRLRLPETHRRADRTVRGRPGRAAEKLHGEFHHALLALESGLTRRGFPDPRARTLQCFFARFPEMAQASDAWNAGGLCSAALTDAHQSAPGWRRKTQYSDSK